MGMLEGEMRMEGEREEEHEEVDRWRESSGGEKKEEVETRDWNWQRGSRWREWTDT